MDLEAYKYSDEEIYQAVLNGKTIEFIGLITHLTEHKINLIIKEQAAKVKE